MAFEFGFYNSIDGDRTYDADQFGDLFTGLITDGVYASIGDALMTTPGSGLSVIVGTGRAWFNKTWNVNRTKMQLNLDLADLLLPRIDAVILEVNKNSFSRTNSIKTVTGTPSANPTRPAYSSTNNVYQYPLAYVYVKANAEAVEAKDITVVVGQSPTNFVTAILDTVDITTMYQHWEQQFSDWFSDVQSQLSGDVATNLLNKINALETSVNGCVKYTDKATQNDIQNAAANKWVSADLLPFYDKISKKVPGTIVLSNEPLKESDGWYRCPSGNPNLDVNSVSSYNKIFPKQLGFKYGPIGSTPFLTNVGSLNTYSTTVNAVRTEHLHGAYSFHRIDGNTDTPDLRTAPNDAVNIGYPNLWLLSSSITNGMKFSAKFFNKNGSVKEWSSSVGLLCWVDACVINDVYYGVGWGGGSVYIAEGRNPQTTTHTLTVNSVSVPEANFNFASDAVYSCGFILGNIFYGVVKTDNTNESRRFSVNLITKVVSEITSTSVNNFLDVMRSSCPVGARGDSSSIAVKYTTSDGHCACAMLYWNDGDPIYKTTILVDVRGMPFTTTAISMIALFMSSNVTPPVPVFVYENRYKVYAINQTSPQTYRDELYNDVDFCGGYVMDDPITVLYPRLVTNRKGAYIYLDNVGGGVVNVTIPAVRGIPYWDHVSGQTTGSTIRNAKGYSGLAVQGSNGAFAISIMPGALPVVSSTVPAYIYLPEDSQ